MNRRKFILAAVTGHLSLTVLHGFVHAAIPVFPTGWTAAFATVVLFLLPVAGAGLVLSSHQQIGVAVLFVAGIVSFGFEGAARFLIGNPDNVAQVADHHASFEMTTILTTMSNLFLVVAAGVIEEFTRSLFRRNISESDVGTALRMYR